MADQKKPTIEELEKILAGGENPKVRMAPDGQVYVGPSDTDLLEWLGSQIPRPCLLYVSEGESLRPGWEVYQKYDGEFGPENHLGSGATPREAIADAMAPAPPPAEETDGA